MAYKIVFLRHGESTWNKENRFTGWTDVDLTEKGMHEAHHAAELLQAAGLSFDMTFTSVLKRAIRTLWIVLDKTDQMWLPVTRAWQLNERHYGALQGLNKSETAKKYGDEKVFTWRRSFKIPPDPLPTSDPRHPKKDRRYQHLKAKEIPATEALYHCMKRVLPFWKQKIIPELKKKKRILIVAHGNSLRALIKHLDQVSDEAISEFNIPTGIPLVYELNKSLKPIRSYYLGDPAHALAAAKAVANQAQVPNSTVNEGM